MFLRFLPIFLGAFLLLVFLPHAAMALDTAAKQAIILDYDTGMVLFEKNADEPMPTSSMSKVMTMYMVFQALQEEKITLNDRFLVSEKAWRKGGSKMFIEVGEKVRVEDLVRGVIIQSGNDAAIALAEGLEGNEDDFAFAATQQAHKMGMKNSNFTNASGWPDPEHHSTARDLATLSYRTIKDFPKYYHYFGEQEFTYNNIKQRNRNPLLYRDIKADGIKTGHTDAGGYGLMASGARHDRRVIVVINGLKDDRGRAQEGGKLLEWGLKAFENVSLFKAGETVDYAAVVMGKDTLVPLVLAEDLNVTIPKSVKNDLKVVVVYNGPLQAPVQKGQPVGTLRVDVPRVDVLEIPLLAGEDVAPIGFFAGVIEKVQLRLGGE